MEPIGKGYGGFDLYPQTPKRYKCDRCGYVTTQTTNHYQPTWSWGHTNTCPNCPPWAKYPEFGGQTTWTCIDTPDMFPDEEAGEQTVAESILREADGLLPQAPGDGIEWLTLEANPPDAPGAVKLVADDGRDILFQSDWDWPAVARNFGWSTNHVPRRSTLDFQEESDNPCDGSDRTDGTVACPVCRKTASSFIAEARQFLDDHDGEACENPGYELSGQEPLPAKAMGLIKMGD